MQNKELLPVHQPLKKQVVGIDAMRFAAALLVLLSHLGFSAWLPSRNGGTWATHSFDVLHPYARFGWIGVQIFFVISGFVIAYSAQGLTPSTFARHRFFRLWPMAFLCATLSTLVVEISFSTAWPQSKILLAYLRTITFWPKGEQIDDPFWTLTVEVVFYLVVFALMALRRLRDLPAVMTAIGFVSTLYWIATAAHPYWSGPRHDYIFRICRQINDRPFLLIQHGCYFAIGVLLWECLLRRFQWRWLLSICMCIGAGVLQIRFSAMASEPYLMMRVPWRTAAALWLLSLALLIAATVYNGRVQAALGRRGVRLFRTLGLVTYPLYLMHNRQGTEITRWLAPHLGYPLSLAIALGCVFTLAYLLAMVVDPRIQRVLKDRFSSKPSGSLQRDSASYSEMPTAMK